MKKTQDKMGKFPLLKGNKVYWMPFSENKKCNVCGEKGDGKGRFICLSGGALRGDAKNAEMDSDLVGFLNICLHDHDYDGKGGWLDIADNTANGQFEFYFCSTHCLRKFFNILVDNFEKSMK